MIGMLVAILFPLALFLALATISGMFAAYGSKMMAALRMEHEPAMRRQPKMAEYIPARGVRISNTGRASAAIQGTFSRAA